MIIYNAILMSIFNKNTPLFFKVDAVLSDNNAHLAYTYFSPVILTKKSLVIPDFEGVCLIAREVPSDRFKMALRGMFYRG